MYAKFYDQIEDPPEKVISMVKRLIQKHKADSKSLLEIGCGTGNVLTGFIDEFKVEGLDLSESMLSFAREKFKDVSFHHADMSDFDLGNRFDVVISVYDSVNHVLSEQGWMGTFKSVHRHLDDDGLFIFDVNMPFKLGEMAISTSRNPYVVRFNGHTMIMSIVESDGMYNWNLEIFELQGDKSYKKFTDKISEIAFEHTHILEMLSPYFDVREVLDRDGEQAGVETARNFYVCRRL